MGNEPLSRLAAPRATISDAPAIIGAIEHSLPVGLELHRGYHYVLPLGKAARN